MLMNVLIVLFVLLDIIVQTLLVWLIHIKGNYCNFFILGSYYCECEPGFAFSRELNACQDLEECATNAHKCTPSQNCINSIGTYACNCRTGYDFNGLGDCIDINECFTGIHKVILAVIFEYFFENFFKILWFQCGDSTCENGDGDYFCRCDQEKGQKGDAHSPDTVYNCDDINECEAYPSPCPQSRFQQCQYFIQLQLKIPSKCYWNLR